MYGWLALEIMSKGATTTILLLTFNLIHMERTLIRRKSYSLKLIKNTVLFGFSYDKPQLFIAFICFVIEIDFTKSKKAPNKY